MDFKSWFVSRLKALKVLGLGFLIGTSVMSFVQYGCSSSTKTFAETSRNDVVEADKSSLKSAVAVQQAFRNIAKSVIPAVVSIQAEKVIVRKYRDPFWEFFEGDEFMRRFFGMPEKPREFERKEKMQSLGSGFIVSKDGYILSNYHVVKGMDKIFVILNGSKKRYSAKVVGSDPELDVAVLKVDVSEDLPTVALGDSDKVQVGDWAIAIGNPFGYQGTFTVGVISALGRHGMTGLQRLIQTDAAINPGNSGGPLLNIYGQVIGINTMIVAPNRFSPGNVGIGFAVPINLAKSAMEQIIKTGKVSRGYLGVEVSELDDATREQLGLGDVGVQVVRVQKGTPAKKVGIKPGDIILEVDGKKIHSPDELVSTIATKPKGAVVNLKVLRGKKKLTFKVKLTERPVPGVAENKNGEETEKGQKTVKFAGISAVELTDDIKSKYRIDTDEGVVIVGVSSDSPFYGKVQPGDVIKKVNDMEIKNLDDFEEAKDKYEKSKRIVLLIQRGDMVLYIGITR